MPALPWTQVLGGQLVGRARELGRLLASLDQAADGQPIVALVSGDAGVGKTRLVAELTLRAGERGFIVLSGRCAELGDSVPYLPLADALRNAITDPSAAAPLLDALASRPALSQLLPDGGNAQLADGDVPGMAQQQLFGAVLGMLAELAAPDPVLLVLEDLHWADRSSRDLVTFLSRVLHRERVAVIATYRTDDLQRSHPLRGVVAELLRLPNAIALELGRLSAPAMAEHLSALADGPLDAAALEAIIRRAEGNAYYAEELLAVSGDGCDLPAGLAALLLVRIEKLSSAAEQVLRVAAVAGRRVDDDVLREAAATGPSLGGVLVDWQGWRAVFFVNLVFGLPALIPARRLLRESRDTAASGWPDGIGAVLLAVGVGAVALAIVKGPQWGWASGRTVGAFAAAALMLVLFLARSAHHPTPVIELGLFRIRSFTVANAGGFVFSIGFFALLLCNVLFLTTVWHYSILGAGAALTPGPITAAVMAPLAGRLADRFGQRAIAVPGSLLFAAGSALFILRTGATAHYWTAFLPAAVLGGDRRPTTWPPPRSRRPRRPATATGR